MQSSPPEFGSILDVVEHVLSKRSRPATSKEIAADIRSEPTLRDWLKGRTPEKTVQARISIDILKFKRNSRFFRFAPAIYGLANKLNAGAYSTYYSRKYLFWRRRRRELSHSYIACVNIANSSLELRRGFLPGKFFPVALLRHLDVTLKDRKENEKLHSSLKKLRYYYCFMYEDSVLRYTRSDFDERNEGRAGLASIGLDGWLTEAHLSMFSNFGYDISQSVYYDASSVFGDVEGLELDISFVGFISDSADRRNTETLAICFTARLSKFVDFDEIKGMRNLEWIPVNPGSNHYHSLENWSKYLFNELCHLNPRDAS